MLTVTDNEGAENSTSHDVTVTALAGNTAPVAYGQPVDTIKNTAVAITLTATDADGDPLSFTYTQPANGTVSGAGPNVTYTPNNRYVGADSFTFTANDGTANSDPAIVSIVVAKNGKNGVGNEAPSVAITAPADLATYTEGDSISFTGSASDAEDDDGVLTASLSWTSSLDGVIGIRASFSTALSAGTHTITASVTDSGDKVGGDAISITVNAPGGNTAPTAMITVPGDGSSFDDGELISFTGSASDAEDGALTASLSWSSSRDGPIGNGASFSTTLSVGTHTITASVTDNDGLPGQDSITVTVNPLGGGGLTIDSATGYKVKGLQKVDLDWSGATTDDVDIFRGDNGGSLVLLPPSPTTTNDGGPYTDNIDVKGGGQTYTYKICEAGSAVCSADATVNF